MYCKNCGNQLDDDSRFCDKCGTNVDLIQESGVKHRKITKIWRKMCETKINELNLIGGLGYFIVLNVISIWCFIISGLIFGLIYDVL